MESQHNPIEETIPNSPPPPPPPSLSSSPSHEFSFTNSGGGGAVVKLSKSSSSPVDFDLSPADDIFFNGHLLPLHLVSHRPSDASMHNTSFLPTSHIETVETSGTAAAATASVRTSVYNDRSSPKSFFLSWPRKWLRGNDDGEDRVDEKQEKKRLKKKIFDIALLWKKYKSLVEPFLFLKDWKEKRGIRRSTQFSFSGDGGRRRQWHGGLSDPASTRTSPVNSGILVTPSATNFTPEELQSAIQAAIVHCKNSIAVEGTRC